MNFVSFYHSDEDQAIKTAIVEMLRYMVYKTLDKTMNCLTVFFKLFNKKHCEKLMQRNIIINP